MKFFTLTITVAMFILSACNNTQKNNSNATTATDSLINYAGNNADTANAEGARLITANDCLTCHKLKDTSVGPSYFDVAKKYHNNIAVTDNLVHSIIHGSVGIWGNKKMTPHPNIDFQDAEKMVRYILSLKDSTTVQ